MKKIGILFGQENIFPQAFIDRVNKINPPGIFAEAVSIDKVLQGEDAGYAVIIDRISHDVPFYRSYLKNAAATGTAVINNPFWWSADDKFFNYSLADKLNITVPRTALLPSFQEPENTTNQSFRNLVYPFDWNTIFEYIGFPAFMKPYNGGGGKDVYKVPDKEDFFKLHATTGKQVMMLQEEIDFVEYYRCFCIGQKEVRVLPYNPNLPHGQHYTATYKPKPALLKAITQQATTLQQYLGYDFNTVEVAVRGDGTPYVIDCYNPAPHADPEIGEANFEWVIETSAQYAIQRAIAQKQGKDNLTWGQFIKPKIKKAISSDQKEKSKPKSAPKKAK
ncbi:hypothetical protein DVR12_00255 [Chitinophaga silvatica]|uniref:ATP-grasp domain-containing protein n=1 Tax=Chitinophaga silvatica TaxID=2282649 RepID=A0A3E1YFT0_9BACT|nr:hypothetical protein [Chitinophaga silvatica]RFS26258.1 hypothetical protein DVR12_00255 [Chitinophaga silvatica]